MGVKYLFTSPPFVTAKLSHDVADNDAICILNGGEVNSYFTPINEGMMRSPYLLHPH